MIDVVNIMRDAIESNIDYTFYINSIELVFIRTYKIYTCDTLHVKLGDVLRIGVDDCTVTEVSLNNYIVVSASKLDTSVTEFETTPLKFYAGTLKDTQEEMYDEFLGQDLQTPFFWLRRPYTRRGNYDEGVLFSEDCDLTFYLLDKSLNVGDGEGVGEMWTSETHDVRVINPLENLYRNRIEKYIDNKKNIFDTIESSDVRELPSIGVESANGNTSELFDATLSGVEVRSNLTLFVNGCKKCLTN